MSDIDLLPSVSAFLAREHGLYIHGQCVASHASSRIAVVNRPMGNLSLRLPMPTKPM